MKETINAVAHKCNECNTQTCQAMVEPCRGFSPHVKKGFSFLEIAAGNSIAAVANLLDEAKLQFVPNNTERGFTLTKG